MHGLRTDLHAHSPAALGVQFQQQPGPADSVRAKLGFDDQLLFQKLRHDAGDRAAIQPNPFRQVGARQRRVQPELIEHQRGVVLSDCSLIRFAGCGHIEISFGMLTQEEPGILIGYKRA